VLGEVLACLDGPLLVIDDTFQILNANAQAFETLGCRADQTNFGHYIVGEAPAQSLDMRRKAKAAVLEGGRTVLMLSHPRHKRLICSVKGMRNGPNHRHGLVVLAPLDKALANAAPYLRDIYKLSHAEAAIALAASTGQDVPQMVRERNVSIHTLRAQIASIKSKMGLSRMTEIAVAVARIQATAALI
jgi:DNA-binding CsgD family transcriptional regulator